MSKRLEYIDQIFAAYDKAGNGWLTMKQTRRFFQTVLELDQHKSKHRNIIRKIFRIVDPENEKKIQKERVLEFFKISGFKIICRLLRE